MADPTCPDRHIYLYRDRTSRPSAMAYQKEESQPRDAEMGDIQCCGMVKQNTTTVPGLMR